MSARWTEPQVTTHPVGRWSLPQATSWRQAAPSEDDASPSGDTAAGDTAAGDTAARDAAARDAATWSAGPQAPVPLAIPTVATWLRDAGRATSLHLVARVGGAAPSSWLGLSCRAETPGAAERALDRARADLGALLDTWGWFAAPAPTAPALDELPALYAVDESDDGEALLAPSHGPAPATLPRILDGLTGWATPLTLHLAVTPAVGDPALVRAAEATARRAVSNDERMALWDQSPLTHEALRLHGRVTASVLEARVLGEPLPGRAVSTWLSQALSHDLGGPVAFAPLPPAGATEEPAAPRALRLHGTRTLRVLELLTTGARPDGTGAASSMD